MNFARLSCSSASNNAPCAPSRALTAPALQQVAVQFKGEQNQVNLRVSLFITKASKQIRELLRERDSYGCQKH